MYVCVCVFVCLFVCAHVCVSVNLSVCTRVSIRVNEYHGPHNASLSSVSREQIRKKLRSRWIPAKAHRLVRFQVHSHFSMTLLYVCRKRGEGK